MNFTWWLHAKWSILPRGTIKNMLIFMLKMKILIDIKNVDTTYEFIDTIFSCFSNIFMYFKKYLYLILVNIFYFYFIFIFFIHIMLKNPPPQTYILYLFYGNTFRRIKRNDTRVSFRRGDFIGRHWMGPGGRHRENPQKSWKK